MFPVTFVRASALSAALLLAGTASAQAPADAIHWKSTVEIEGGQQSQGAGPMEAEIWLKKGSMRSKMVVMGMTRNVVKSGDTMYQWADGEKKGMKFDASVAKRQGPGGDYANRIEEYRSRGKKTGTETIDGHPCDIYELDVPSAEGRGGRMETVWLATDLRNFPLKVVVEQGGMKVTSRNRDVDFSTRIPDSLLKPPSDVEFRDMSKMIRGEQPPER
jgi:outer membrane lipoprotein-sorting protein